MNAFEIPSLRYSLPAGGAVKRHRFVSADSSSNAIQATNATVVIGASMNEAASGEVLEIADGLVIVEAAGAITAGAAVASDANGKVVAYASGTTGDACGVAITAATAAGNFVTVKVN